MNTTCLTRVEELHDQWSCSIGDAHTGTQIIKTWVFTYFKIMIGEWWQLCCFDLSVKRWSHFPVFTRSSHTVNNDHFIHDYSNTLHNSLTSYRLKFHNISSPTGWINCLHMWLNDGAGLHCHVCVTVSQHSPLSRGSGLRDCSLFLTWIRIRQQQQ